MKYSFYAGKGLQRRGRRKSSTAKAAGSAPAEPTAGGAGAEAKLIDARSLGLPVILIDRPKLPARRVLAEVADVMAWLDHPADLGV